MTGTEKQIKWANEIMAKVNPVFDWTIENAPAANIKEYAESVKNTVNAAYAGKIIDCYKNYEATGNNEKDMQSVFSKYKSYQKVSSHDNKF